MEALPDFTFPDYGNVILEHLGLITDPNYFERWESKAKEYEKKGIRYFRTSEEEIRNISATVDRLQNQFRSWTEQHAGVNRPRLIEALERVRCIAQLQIQRPLGAFEDGVFEIDNSQIVAIALCKEDFSEGTLSAEAATLSQSPMTDNVQGEHVSWTVEVFDKITLWVARHMQ